MIKLKLDLNIFDFFFVTYHYSLKKTSKFAVNKAYFRLADRTNMSNSTYLDMDEDDKPLVWMHGVVKTPPFSESARLRAGFLLIKLQKGYLLEMPDLRPMPSVGKDCHELRINDQKKTWRIIYFIDQDAIVLLEVFAKKSQHTPQEVIDTCKKRLAHYQR